MPNEHLLTAQEVADMLKVNIMTVYRYIKAGKLRAYKIGKELRIESADLKMFMNGCSTLKPL